jgi:hypothetical protein
VRPQEVLQRANRMPGVTAPNHRPGLDVRAHVTAR